MKTPKYNPRVIKLILLITILIGLQISFLSEAIPTQIVTETQSAFCVICIDNKSTTQKEGLFSELFLLAPSTPKEALFSDEEVSPEINLAPTTPEDASFNDESEFMSSFGFEYLAPTTPAEADFND